MKVEVMFVRVVVVQSALPRREHTHSVMRRCGGGRCCGRRRRCLRSWARLISGSSTHNVMDVHRRLVSLIYSLLPRISHLTNLIFMDDCMLFITITRRLRKYENPTIEQPSIKTSRKYIEKSHTPITNYAISDPSQSLRLK